MKLNRWLILGIFFVSSVAACGGSERANVLGRSRDPSGGSGGEGGASTAAGGASTGGMGGASTGGGGGEGGESNGTGGTVPGLECPSDDVAIPTGDYACEPSTEVAEPESVALDLGAGSILAVGVDELSVLYSSLGSSAEEFFLAERADTASDFGAPVQLLLAERPIGMRPDGLALVATNPERTTLFELSRGAAFEDFGPAAVGDFAALNAHAAANDYGFSEVVESPAGTELFYGTFDLATGEGSIRRSVRAGASGDWPPGAALSACEFSGFGSLRRRPIALSNDGLTLFYEDELRGLIRAAYRSEAAAEFTAFLDWEGPAWLSPNLACDAFYLRLSTGLARGARP